VTVAEAIGKFRSGIADSIPGGPKISALSGLFSLGIAGAERPRFVLWFHLQITEGKISLVAVSESPVEPRVTHNAGVDVAVVAASTAWAATGTGGLDRFFELIHSLDFDIAGSLAFFIRHLESIVALLIWFASVVSTISGSPLPVAAIAPIEE
jgi:hypothetical protein